MKYSYTQLAIVASTKLIDRIRVLQARLNTYTGSNATTERFIDMTSQYFDNVCDILEDENRQISNNQLMHRLLNIDTMTDMIEDMRRLTNHLDNRMRNISIIRFRFDLLLSHSCGEAGTPVSNP